MTGRKTDLENGKPLAVKICGITRRQDAVAASLLGAWALGFIFWKGSPRFIEPASAGMIVRGLPGTARAVGVFVNASLEEIQIAVTASGVDTVQLHGDESPDFARGLKFPFWKAMRLAGPKDLEGLQSYPSAESFLFDAAVPGQWGGTGEKSDWTLARQARGRMRPEAKLILSGGLHPASLEEACDAVSPDAIDVSSGVEESPGIKSERKLEELFAAAARWKRGTGTV